MKYDTYSQYDPRIVGQTLPAFFTAWQGLQDCAEDLVVVGGLVPHFICKHAATEIHPPVTLDVDLGIALGAEIEHLTSLKTNLQMQGFRMSQKFPGRYEKTVNGNPVYLDFLTEDGMNTRGSRMVVDVVANTLPGINRALETARTMTLSGTDLDGERHVIKAHICEAGAFLVLKLRAFADRKEPKDAFDILYTVLHYDKGLDAAISSFADEAKFKNIAFPAALVAVKDYFLTETSEAPAAAAKFMFDELRFSTVEELELARIGVRQDMVMVAQKLISVA